MKSSKFDFVFEHRAIGEVLTGINDLLRAWRVGSLKDVCVRHSCAMDVWAWLIASWMLNVERRSQDERMTRVAGNVTTDSDLLFRQTDSRIIKQWNYVGTK